MIGAPSGEQGAEVGGEVEAEGDDLSADIHYRHPCELAAMIDAPSVVGGDADARHIEPAGRAVAADPTSTRITRRAHFDVRPYVVSSVLVLVIIGMIQSAYG